MDLKLKTPWRVGMPHLVTSPLEFMQGLAALVPRPPLNLIRFHGVLAPNAKLRPCPICGAGELKINAAILERPVDKILTHLGLAEQPPPKGRGARTSRASPGRALLLEPRQAAVKDTSP